MTDTQEQQYIEQVLDGNVNAYEHLVNRHKGMVHTIAMRIVRNQEDAEEVTQDTFLKAFQKLSTFKGGSKFSTWLYRITYNVAVSKTRKKQLDTADMEDETLANLDLNSTSDTLDGLKKEEQKRYIDSAIEQLPEDQSLILTLFYLNENSIEEIVEITKMTAGNVKVKLHRARKKLLGLLENMLHTEVRSLL
ncbi:MAG: RNA polymerase sigma factor (sigma-70 family) [Granulosicoccus sp.]|jgi:RNA polymerase sigma factor (sigma-70 family)